MADSTSSTAVLGEERPKPGLAGDAELPVLVERCLRGELPTTDAVKREVKEWRPDYLRA